MCRVLSTVYFTAHSIGQVTSLAPDLTKAKVSATRILALLKRKPQIDASKDDGIKLVANFSISLSVSHRLSLSVSLSLLSPTSVPTNQQQYYKFSVFSGQSQWDYCCRFSSLQLPNSFKSQSSPRSHSFSQTWSNAGTGWTEWVRQEYPHFTTRALL